MPYKSEAQRRYFNANREKLEAEGVDVDEWNDSSKGKKLPKKSEKSAVASLARRAAKEKASSDVLDTAFQAISAPIAAARDAEKEREKEQQKLQKAVDRNVRERMARQIAKQKLPKIGADSAISNRQNRHHESLIEGNEMSFDREKLAALVEKLKGRGVCMAVPKPKGITISKKTITVAKPKKKKEQEKEAKSPAWQRSEGKNSKGGLNEKGRKSYERENPGSDLKAPVTGKVKPGGKAAKRRKSFCARMKGNKGPMKKPNGEPTRKALSLRKWKCGSDVVYLSAEQRMGIAKLAAEKLARRCWEGYEAVPGKKPYSDDSCRKAGGKKKKEKQAGKRGLWDNVHAKRKRGEKPAKPGDKDYPDKKSWKKTVSASK